MFAISMAGIFVSEEFKVIGIPALSCIICVAAKIGSRSRKQKGTTWNEWAIGIDLILTAIILMITRSIDRFIGLNQGDADDRMRHRLNEEYTEGLWILFLLMTGLLMTTIAISQQGWRNKEQLHKFWGVVLPDLIGLALLVLVFNKY